MAMVTLRYWAAAREAAGMAEQTVTAATLADALALAGGPAGPDQRLRGVLALSSFLVDGQPVGIRVPDQVILAEGTVIEVLPPFAGG